MRVASLFAGIGGLDLGFERQGAEIALLCEIDPAARAVLRTRFQEANIHGDIRTLRRLPKGTDVLTAGFPCQNLSMVGDKSGLDGESSGLVKVLLDMLKTRRLPWVILENVPFMLQLARGSALRYVLTTLEDAGYRWAYRTVDALGFGLPQRRRRILIVASTSGSPEDVLLADDGGNFPAEEPTVQKPIGFYWTEGRSGSGLTSDAIPPLKAGSGLGIPSPPAVLMPDGSVLRPPLRELERLQGFDEDWTEPAENHGKGARWKLVGNAVPVPIGAWIAHQICHPGMFDRENSQPLDREKLLPSAAFGKRGAWYAAAHVSMNPSGRVRPKLSTFMRQQWDPLSDRAIKGFVSRARGGTLRFPESFLDRVEAAASIAC